MSKSPQFAEVIGDPVAQSKSPLIHEYWLGRLQIEGNFVRSRVRSHELEEHLALRRSDPKWRGCNVTIPHKERIVELLDGVDERASKIGAVNCVVRRSGGLYGTNTDVDGVGAALGKTPLEGARVAILGGGGASRAAIAYLEQRNIDELVILVRDLRRAEALRPIAPGTRIEILEMSAAETAFEGAAAIINATPMGMTGAEPMSDELISAVARKSADTVLFDLVYEPIETAFLSAGRKAGARIVDGLTMLVGQAVTAFELFFDAAPPAPDEKLRSLLLSNVSPLSAGPAA